MANTKEVVEGLKKVDFMVQVDQFWGPMAEMADIVLPAAHWLEIDDIYDMHPRFFIEAHNKCVEPPGEAKSDVWIFNEIGKRVAPQYWFKDVETLLDYELEKATSPGRSSARISFPAASGQDQVYYKYKTDYWRKGGGFPTPTGKMELYSTVLEKMGYDPLPYFKEPGESPYSTPELAKEYPLVLTTGFRSPFYFLAQYRNIPWLRSFMEYPDHADQSGDGQKTGDRRRRLCLDRIAAGQNHPESPAVPRHRPEGGRRYRQLVLPGSAGRRFPRRVYLQSQRPDQQ